MRIVIKIGTSTLTHRNGCVNLKRFESLCRVVSDIKNAGNEIILVSSGAIAMGVGRLNLSEKPKSLSAKQACAAVGQSELMYLYDKHFSEYNHTVAQMLLTAPDLKNPERHKKFEATLNQLLSFGALPIINENDTVSTAEIEFGDNDTLAAEVAVAAAAQLLVLLSDIDGLYTADPRKEPLATIIPDVYEITPEIEAVAGGAGSSLGTGGMETKIRAAKIATAGKCDMIISNGAYPERLYSITEGQKFGTKFHTQK